MKFAIQITKEEYQYERFILTCDKSNIASAKIIEAYGGILEGEIIEDNSNVILRYIIQLP